MSTFFFSCQYVELQHQPTQTPFLNLVGEACSLRRDEVESARRCFDILCGCLQWCGLFFGDKKPRKPSFKLKEAPTNTKTHTCALSVRCQYTRTSPG
jgi:hypothetical protein